MGRLTEWVTKQGNLGERHQAERRYRAAVRVLFVLSVAGLFFAWWWRGQDRQGLADLAQAVGDASLVAFVIIFAVEPYMRSKFQRDTLADILWGLFNPDAPPEYKEALDQLSRTRHYHLSTLWTIRLDWADEAPAVLRVTTGVRHEGCSREPGGYVPSGERWVLASTDTFKSAYELWELVAPGIPAWRYDNLFDEERLREKRFVGEDNDGAVLLDEAKVAHGRFVPSGTNYVATRRTRMFRHQIGYIPLVYSLPSLRVEVRVTGNAVGDLDIKALHPGLHGKMRPQIKSLDQDPLIVDYLTMPGQSYSGLVETKEW